MWSVHASISGSFWVCCDALLHICHVWMPNALNILSIQRICMGFGTPRFEPNSLKHQHREGLTWHHHQHETAQILGCKSIRLGGWWTVLLVWRQIYNQPPDTLDANHYPPWPWRKGTTLISDTPLHRPLRNFVACFSVSRLWGEQHFKKKYAVFKIAQ